MPFRLLSLFRQNGQIIFFLFTNHTYILLLMIIIPTQMQDPMDHHPMQLFFKRNIQPLRIFLHALCADVDFSHERIFIERKGDDVGEIIVIQMGAVDLQQEGIRTKDKIKSVQPEAFRLNRIRYPLD